jgi:hypothetical protein
VSTGALVAGGALALIALGAVILVVKLFWPRAVAVTDPADPWAQHNELRSPSLEQMPEAAENEVSTAVAAQILGTD